MNLVLLRIDSLERPTTVVTWCRCHISSIELSSSVVEVITVLLSIFYIPLTPVLARWYLTFGHQLSQWESRLKSSRNRKAGRRLENWWTMDLAGWLHAGRILTKPSPVSSGFGLPLPRPSIRQSPIKGCVYLWPKTGNLSCGLIDSEDIALCINCSCTFHLNTFGFCVMVFRSRGIGRYRWRVVNLVKRRSLTPPCFITRPVPHI